MPIAIETPSNEQEILRFLEFHDEIYASRSAHWTAIVPFQLALLTGQSPFAHGRTFQPFVARDGARIVARVLAVIDERYQNLWDEPLGHLSFFEARPDTREATRKMMDAACDWLRSKGARAARAGMGALEFPFAVEDVETLPPCFVRQNPAYYQSLLKDAGFMTEKGLVDYRIRVTPELIQRWEGAVAAAKKNGFRLVPLVEVPGAIRLSEFMFAYNEPFLQHWGYSPFTEEEIGTTFQAFAPFGILEHSLIAYRGDEPMGAVWVQRDTSALARVASGRTLAPWEKVNFLGIAVRKPGRGQGVNLAMASHTYLELARRGYQYVSYTLVLDDNWPSRRTAEKLGAAVCNNFLVYRRELER
jgi:GNAT superfamily N-acetyltransferase